MHDPAERIPLLVVAGMSRSGTTFLYHNLQRHPGVFVPPRKEVCYFAHNHDRGYDWFRAFYRGIGPGQLGLDVCGLYFMDSEAADRLAAHDPEQRVVLGLRSPREWAFSIYEQYSGNFDIPPFREFFSGCRFEREGKEIPFRVTPGQIRATVERFAEIFGDRLLVFDFRLLASDPLLLLRTIEEFGGLEAWFDEGRFTATKINARGRRRSERFDRILQVRGVADAIARAVPRRLLLGARRWIDARSSRGVAAEPPAPSYSEADLIFLDRLVASDAEWMETLFEGSPIRYGHRL